MNINYYYKIYIAKNDQFCKKKLLVCCFQSTELWSLKLCLLLLILFSLLDHTIFWERIIKWHEANTTGRIRLPDFLPWESNTGHNHLFIGLFGQFLVWNSSNGSNTRPLCSIFEHFHVLLNYIPIQIPFLIVGYLDAMDYLANWLRYKNKYYNWSQNF